MDKQSLDLIADLLEGLITLLLWTSLFKHILLGGEYSIYNRIKYGKEYSEWYDNREKFSPKDVVTVRLIGDTPINFIKIKMEKNETIRSVFNRLHITLTEEDLERVRYNGMKITTFDQPIENGTFLTKVPKIKG